MSQVEEVRELSRTTALSAIGSVCVYCGSGLGTNPVFGEAADKLGRSLAERGIRVVYGGGDVGLMGRVARSALEAGGHVTGIIPEFLRRRENMLSDVQETVVVPDMHTRKRLMFDKSDGFIALPDGIGTLEELVEQMTWAQLGRHKKPILLVDIDGFWRPLITLLDHMRDYGFIRPGLELNYVVADRVEDVFPLLEATAQPRRDHAREEFIEQHF